MEGFPLCFLMTSGVSGLKRTSTNLRDLWVSIKAGANRSVFFFLPLLYNAIELRFCEFSGFKVQT